MSLMSALDAAKSSLASNSVQSAIVSRNIAGVNDPGFSRKWAKLESGIDGVGYVASIARATNSSLQAKALATTAAAATQDALSAAYDRISQSIGSSADGISASSRISALNSSLLAAAANPANTSVLRAAAQSARDLATTLNEASAAVQHVRQQADVDVANSVETINALLAQFKTANDAVLRGDASGADTTVQMDARDRILTSLSGEIGISVVPGRDRGLAIYADNGVVLFDKDPRSVAFQAKGAISATTVANAVTIDGVDVSSANVPMGLKSGKLAGTIAVRDTLAPQYQSQIDEIARGLINSFRETDQSTTPVLPDQPGLFTWSGAPGMPGPGRVAGLAASIAVSTNVDPASGGDIARLRDGSLSDPGNSAYRYNATGGSGYSARLQQLVDNLAMQQGFDPATGLGTMTSVAALATDSIGWVESGRKSTADRADQQKAVRDQATQALTSQTGVNLDDEMSRMLDIEHSYQASAKLIAGIDQMFISLFQAIA